jgi:AraC family transcriptional regulator
MEAQHLQALNRVLDYIQTHLADPLTIDSLAEVACYSEYHFQRVFKRHVGESVQKYVHRKRLERAAELLRSQTSMTVTDIALSSGFSNSASFAKAFKSQFKMSATQWRESQSSHYLSDDASGFRLTLVNGLPNWKWEEHDANIFTGLPACVQLELMPVTRVAYVRSVGQYMANESMFLDLYQRLFSWAASNDALSTKTQTYNFYSDSPDITEGEKLQVLASITVDDAAKPAGDIGIKKYPGGMYAIARFKLTNETFKLAWQWLYDCWLPQSGLTLDDRVAFERSAGKTENAGEYIVDIGVPVK